MSEPRKRVDSLAEGLWQRSDEITSREPFSCFRKRRPVRVTEDTVKAQARHMVRALTWRHVAVLEALRRRVRP